MSDIDIRRSGRAGRVTLTRPKALNALTYEMATQIETALDAWADDAAIACVIIDAEGEKAFCAGGDLAAMYDTASRGDFAYGRRFWQDEYRLNAKIFDFPKPYIAFCQGFTMGGGVGISLHGSHRIVCESSRISMPECGIGLVPDVGGSLLLARAPGRLGEYLGLTAHQMDASDALLAGFADYFIPEAKWPALIATLEETGDWSAVDAAAENPPNGALTTHRAEIDLGFAGATVPDILRGLAPGAFAAKTETAIRRCSPLSVACTLELVRRVRAFDHIRPALEMEYRFTYRSAEEGDFVEGIRAMIIDKDRQPKWKHESVEAVPQMDMVRMLIPLGDDTLDLD
ncbi:enoyl-CoA hydratase/isomerase family protein [Algicella marina]|uniref:3-hydroxyisobutyryl-CoA hydrolase n=1 Tax=Algicella marina TaxID=2683284 RepID=A0A6P1SV07_9RHOB|nr:enoyl-CoA hydratase/isomerase family protein [Algicella marina]QHQ34524.1 enoyl-CoA hydratase/isomerase family protein [Algicella marina]